MKLVLEHKCVVTNKPYSVVVNREDYTAWQQGELAQNAFPYLSAGDREFIISGISPDGWDETFKEEQ